MLHPFQGKPNEEPTMAKRQGKPNEEPTMANDSPKDKVVVALFQGKADKGNHLNKMKRQMIRAASAGAELLIFPELFLTGYHVPGEEMKRLAEERDGPSFRELSRTARESNIAVLYGYPEVDRSSGAPVYYNSAQLIDRDGTSLVNYRKTHLWISPAPPQYESVFTPGSRFEEPVECCGLKIGILICNDASFSETARSLALSGANFISVISASSIEYNRRCSNLFIPTRALDNSVYVALVNYVGGGLDGCSQLCDPNGTVVVYSGSDSEEALLLGNISLPVTSRLNYLGMRRPELYNEVIKQLASGKF